MFSNKIKLSAIFALFIGMLFAVNSVQAQAQEESGAAVITGKVVDANAQQPVTGIELKIKGTEQTAETDKKGNFSFTGLEPGSYTIVASVEGYKELTKEVELSAPGNELTIKLKPSSSS